ncbi:lipase [Acinetobacter sp. NCu2D-2]|uniref:SGNH/GDSL hydrolase family protein n=1 Tax=Acinetobacter sp. NCu2D-2 TaxID=1608473 RepID=UPI0007CDB327|nr:SGNH/GDSL hydrolase family protein [Acinetobacter sp. NCu2D-2]ANF81812.1 lipase [Acinetobacter sp. NCu2D-2]
MLLKFTTIALIPILLFQGKKVKKNTPRLPEPEGTRQGNWGQGKPLSILILGDSAAAGVGVQSQQDALSGAILKELENEYAIEWKLHAKSGHTTPKVIQNFGRLDSTHYDVVITSVGVNDVLKFMDPDNWIENQQNMYKFIDEKFSPSLIIAAGVPPMNMFPALPKPLGWLFGKYAHEMNQKLNRLVEERHNLQWIEYDVESYKKLNLSMADDGFHPSKEIYALWGKEVANKIRKQF